MLLKFNLLVEGVSLETRNWMCGDWLATDLGLGLSMTAQAFIPAWGDDAEDKHARVSCQRPVTWLRGLGH